VVTALSERPLFSGRDEPVTTEEIRAAAYRYTSRVTAYPWEPHRVNINMGPVAEFLEKATDRADFEMRCWALDEQTLNLGLHPLQRWSPLDTRNYGDPDSETVSSPGLPTPSKLVKAAELILGIIT